MDLSCLFVNYNSWRLVAGALRSLRDHPPLRADGRPCDCEVVVVDNASPRADPEGRSAVEQLVAAMGGRVILHGENGGYAKGMNLAWRHSRGRLVLACNPDIEFCAGALSRLIACIEADPGMGVAAPAVFGDRTRQVHLPVHVLPTIGDLVWTTLGTISMTWNRRYSRRRTRAALAVWGVEEPVEERMFGGCCFLTSRAVIERLGFFDERYPLYFEDTDLSLRIRRAGFRIVRVGNAHVVHIYGRSTMTNRAEAQARHEQSRRHYFAKWYGWRGQLALAVSEHILGSRWARARARRIAARPARELAREDGRPVLVLPRSCARFLIEIAFEPFLFLAAAAFGSGSRWVPGDGVLAELHQETWLRALDLSGPEPVELGLWRYVP